MSQCFVRAPVARFVGVCLWRTALVSLLLTALLGLTAPQTAQAANIAINDNADWNPGKLGGMVFGDQADIEGQITTNDSVTNIAGGLWLSTSVAAPSLTLGGNLEAAYVDLSRGSLTVGSGCTLTLRERLHVEGTGKVSLTDGGTLRLTNTSSASGVASGGEIHVGKNSLLEFTDSFNLKGTLIVDGGTVSGVTSSDALRLTDATTTLKGNARLLGNTVLIGDGTFGDTTFTAENLLITEGSTFTVNIDTNGIYTATAQAINVEKGGTLDIQRQTFTSTGLTTVGGKVSMGASAPNNTPTLATAGLAVQSGGEVLLQMNGTLTDSVGTTVNGGTLKVQDAATFSTPSLTVQGGGTVTAWSGSVLTAPSIIITGAGSRFTNQADFSLESGKSLVLTDGAALRAQAGTVDKNVTVNGGSLTVGNSSVTAASLAVLGGGTLNLKEGAQLNLSGNTLSATGQGSKLKVETNTLNVGTGKVYALADKATLEAFNVAIDEGGKLNFTNNAEGKVSGKTSITGTGQLTIDATSMYSTGSLALINGGKAHVAEGGKLDINTLVVSGALSSYTQQGDMVIENGKGITVENGAMVTASGAATVKGILVVGSNANDATASVAATSLTVQEGGSLTLMDGGALKTNTVTVTGNQSLFKAQDLAVDTATTYTVEKGGRLEAGSVTLKDRGLLNVADGGSMASNLVNFEGGTYRGTLALNDATAVLNAHRPASGLNLVDGRLNVLRGQVNLGTDTLAGQLKVTGDVTLGAASTVQVNLAQMAQAAQGSPVLTGSGSNRLNVDAASTFKITGGKEGSYQITKDFAGGITTGAWSTVGSTSSALKTTGEWDASGQIYTVRVAYNTPADPTKPDVPNTQPMLPGVSSSVGDMAVTMVKQLGVDTESPNMGHRFYSRAMDERYMGRHSGEPSKPLKAPPE